MTQLTVDDRLSIVAPSAANCGMTSILLSASSLHDFARQVDEQRGDRTVVVVIDETTILRNDQDLKAGFLHELDTAQVPVKQVVIRGEDPHTTFEHIGSVHDALTTSSYVIALGSGTVVDITKHAVFLFEQEHPSARLELTSVQTANSVCAYTSGLCVTTLAGGVKRTVPSRLPDNLVLDITVLEQAPRGYTQGGIGDASVAAVSFADYRLSHLLGLSAWDESSWELMRPTREAFLAQDESVTGDTATQAGAIALDLAACGIAMTIAGESAPLSGLEHVTSHMLDMAAASQQRPVGNHGTQCALASILSLIAFTHLLGMDELDFSTLSRIDLEQERNLVGEVFAPVDPQGRAVDECWKDYAAKIVTWQNNTRNVDQFSRQWHHNRADLSRFVADPRQFVAALAAAGHPLRFEDLAVPISHAQIRWAFMNARLMRKRTTVADVLAFTGQWTDDFIDHVMNTYLELTSSYPTHQ